MLCSFRLRGWFCVLRFGIEKSVSPFVVKVGIRGGRPTDTPGRNAEQDLKALRKVVGRAPRGHNRNEEGGKLIKSSTSQLE